MIGAVILLGLVIVEVVTIAKVRKQEKRIIELEGGDGKAAGE